MFSSHVVDEMRLEKTWGAVYPNSRAGRMPAETLSCVPAPRYNRCD